MAYFMGIDTGTNSSKGVLIDGKGRIIAQHSTEHAMENPRPNYFEYDAVVSTRPQRGKRSLPSTAMARPLPSSISSARL